MFQKVIVVGRLGGDPEMKYLPSGDPVTSFSLATDNKYTNKAGEKVSETTWFRVTVFGKMAENCNQYLSKGKMALVEGKLQADKATGSPRIWNKKDGTPAASFELTASEVRFLSARTEEPTEQKQEEKAEEEAF